MSKLAQLRGSPAQVSWAISLRQIVLNRLADAGATDKIEALSRVSDSTWWIANKDNFARNMVKPPAPHQLEGYVPTAEPATVPVSRSAPAAVSAELRKELEEDVAILKEQETPVQTTGQKHMRKTDYAALAAQRRRHGGQSFTNVARAVCLFEQAKEENPYLYFELAYTRKTDWMCWLVDKQGSPKTDNRPCAYPTSTDGYPVLGEGQGETPNDACARIVEVLERITNA